MSYCLCFDSPSNDLWIAERNYGETYQQVIDGFGDVIFEGSYNECKQKYDEMRADVTYAVYYHHGGMDKFDNDGYYIVPIKNGDGSYQDNQREYGDSWVRSFYAKEEAEKYINIG